MTSNETLNASAEITNSMGNTWGLAPIVLVVIIGAIAAPLLSQTVYAYLTKKASVVGRTLVYALKGFITVTIFGLVLSPVYFLAQADTATQINILQWLAGMAALFGVFVVAGYIGDHIWNVVNTRHEQATGETIIDRLTPEETEEDAA